MDFVYWKVSFSLKNLPDLLAFRALLSYLCHCNHELDSVKLHQKEEAVAFSFFFVCSKPKGGRTTSDGGRIKNRPPSFYFSRRLTLLLKPHFI